jgi:hypothetical protein
MFNKILGYLSKFLEKNEALKTAKLHAIAVFV